MINYIICFGICFSPDQPAIPERVCEITWQRIDAHYHQLLHIRDTFGAAGHLDQELELTRRWRELWWATWWIHWPRATPEDLETWRPIHRARLAEWLKE